MSCCNLAVVAVLNSSFLESGIPLDVAEIRLDHKDCGNGLACSSSRDTHTTFSCQSHVITAVPPPQLIQDPHTAGDTSSGTPRIPSRKMPGDNGKVSMPAQGREWLRLGHSCMVGSFTSGAPRMLGLLFWDPASLRRVAISSQGLPLTWSL